MAVPIADKWSVNVSALYDQGLDHYNVVVAHTTADQANQGHFAAILDGEGSNAELMVETPLFSGPDSRRLAFVALRKAVEGEVAKLVAQARDRKANPGRKTLPETTQPKHAGGKGKDPKPKVPPQSRNGSTSRKGGKDGQGRKGSNAKNAMQADKERVEEEEAEGAAGADAEKEEQQTAATDSTRQNPNRKGNKVGVVETTASLTPPDAQEPKRETRATRVEAAAAAKGDHASKVRRIFPNLREH